MTHGISIHIGLNRVDPSHYQDQNGSPWDGRLYACEFDANDMQDIASAMGFEATVILDEEATSSRIAHEIADAAGKLEQGDILLITYSGHGGQLPDVNEEEEDRLDETWALYERQLLDDELFALWVRFAAGVRIFVLSDSCHSGTILRAVHTDPHDLTRIEPSKNGDVPGDRALPRGVQVFTYDTNQAMYDELRKSNPAGDQAPVEASVLLISGCQSNQLSLDGFRNGLFTETLRAVWNDGAFPHDFLRFHREIQKRMPDTQSPNLQLVGVRDAAFESQTPFTI